MKADTLDNEVFSTVRARGFTEVRIRLSRSALTSQTAESNLIAHAVIEQSTRLILARNGKANTGSRTVTAIALPPAAA